MVSDEKRLCQFCQKEIHGRLDKKFCNTYCKNAHNNKIKRKEEQFIYNVNSILRKNRRILKTLNPIGMTTIRKSHLKNAGYNFHYFTNIFKTDKGALYYFCYDVGFAQIRGEKVVLVTYQDYMKEYADKNEIPLPKKKSDI